MPSVSLFLFFFSSKCIISNHYRAIIPPTPNFLWFSAPEQVVFFSFFFFISQRREFESQPTQTTFTVWQMKLINNLKHALAEAHTIMSLNMFLHAAEMHLNRSPVVHIKGKHNSCCSFTSPYISIIFTHSSIHTVALPSLWMPAMQIQHVGTGCAAFVKSEPRGVSVRPGLGEALKLQWNFK